MDAGTELWHKCTYKGSCSIYFTSIGQILPVSNLTTCWHIKVMWLLAGRAVLHSTDEAHHIQQATVGQASNALWLELHDSTITSSNIKKVFRRQSAYTLFLTQCSSRTTLVIRQSLLMGGLMKAMLGSCMSIKCTQMEGMLRFRSVAYVYIRSIDSLVSLQVYDNSTVDSFDLLEKKCPYKPYTLKKTIQEACDDAQFHCTVDGQLCLKKAHTYYYQVQGQMAITALHSVCVTSLCGWVMMTFMWNVSTLTLGKGEVEMLPKLPYAYQQYLHVSQHAWHVSVCIHNISQGALYITLITCDHTHVLSSPLCHSRIFLICMYHH